MRFLGYVDKLSVVPGMTVRFMVSSEAPRYRAEIVRLLNADHNPAGPGIREAALETPVTGDYAGKIQSLPVGSFIRVSDHAKLRAARFTLAAWIQPTLPAKGLQAVISKCTHDGASGHALVINERGELAIRLGGSDVEVASGKALRQNNWYFVAASVDATAKRVTLVQWPYPEWPVEDTRVTVDREIDASFEIVADVPLLIGAYGAGGATEHPHGGFLNGKVEAPMVFADALTEAQLMQVSRGEVLPGIKPVASWDLSRHIPTDRIEDVSGNELHGTAVNMPARGMVGHDFGDCDEAWPTSNYHRAIHFHDDDIEDARWDSDFEFVVPASLRSGVYAAKLTAQDVTDYIPFYVRPAGGKASAKVLFLVPTNSHLAYANFMEPYAREEGSLGLYHHHGDESAVFYSSRLRPIINMRPTAYFPPLGGTGGPHQFVADMHLVDWLDAKGIEFDVAIDEDLYREGHDLLSQYSVVLSGTHPEYWSTEMYDALDTYLGNGGRFMYLGGNGLIWVTSFDPARPHVVEVRRAPGRAMSAGPGERYHSTTGEKGGAWQDRRRPPWERLGIGSVAQGFDRSVGYTRAAGSFDPRASWIFDGIGDDEIIGDFGLVMGGAAGFEIDAFAPDRGSPAHTLVLATATGYSDKYEFQQPNFLRVRPGGPKPVIHCDMSYMETPNGGAVFSAGSIAFCGSLAHNRYDNSVSRITENVLRRFASGEPLPPGQSATRARAGS